MITPPLVQVQGSPFKPTQSFETSGFFLIGIVLFVTVIVLVWAIWGVWKRRSEIGRQWNELVELSQRVQLTREEFAFLRRTFRRARVKEPMAIMRSEAVYASFFSKHSQWASHRSDYLTRTIYRKVFGTALERDGSK